MNISLSLALDPGFSAFWLWEKGKKGGKGKVEGKGGGKRGGGDG